MMGKQRLIFVFSVVLCGSAVNTVGAYGGLTLEGVECGQKICRIYEYCSRIHSNCEDCSVACNKSSPGYIKKDCEDQCQDYLHDIKYVRKGDGGDDGLKGRVDNLSRMVTITLTLVILMLVVLACLLCFQLYRWKVKKNITLEVIRNKLFKKSNSPTNNTASTQEVTKRDLRLEMPSPTVNSDHSPVTVTTSIDRRPAEDSALDYAYDNPVMTNKSQNSSF